MNSVKTLAFTALSLAAAASLCAQTGPFSVTLVSPVHGKVQVTPALPADGKVAAGTVLTLTATPDPGYGLDSTWYSVKGQFGQMFHEGTTREYKITVDQDKQVGASFVDEAIVKDLVVTNDVIFAKPGRKTLKYDVYAPKGARNLPMIMIVHGGGWSANDEDVMRGLARELTKTGKFVVASMDYRWSGKNDGDPNTTMANIVEDTFGGIAHMMEHASQYGGDPTRIGVTGDSAGGHLAAVASLMTNMIGSHGYAKTPGVYEFMPTYMPKGKTVEQVRDEMMKAIKAGAPSYGVFSPTLLHTYAEDPAVDKATVEGIAPLLHIPAATERSVPQFLTRGTNDRLISDAAVKEFTDALVKAGQRVEYVQVGGASHAFFDWKPNETTKATFAKYGVYYAGQMRDFFTSILY